MLFSWDPAKAKENLRKHRVSFELAQSVFDDPLQVSLRDIGSHREERWVTIGRCANRNTLVVIHTYRVIENEQELVRIISARRATRNEKRDYEEGI